MRDKLSDSSLRYGSIHPVWIFIQVSFVILGVLAFLDAVPERRLLMGL
jgi:hypothetical protein